ncbi:hypothetical protein [Paenibacillus silvisoli]|uniref:hypothetical protein n=1 Tax=Paenibacillus silvisoli TaxID=3110539 RepID=UPI0028059E61|nr:hypothetical protein [Paenibacillus silvisoli]
MAERWTESDEIYLRKLIPAYRKAIEGKDVQTTKKITLEMSEVLHRTTPGLHHRSIESINQRLPYLDNLMAGVFERSNYALKDQRLYAALPREDESKSPNLANTRHSYNGALR